MSEEQLKAFIAKVQADASLQERLKAAANDDSIISIAIEAGFSIDSEDMLLYSNELSESELESMAGGDFWNCVKNLWAKGASGCTERAQESKRFDVACVPTKVPHRECFPDADPTNLKRWGPGSKDGCYGIHSTKK